MVGAFVAEPGELVSTSPGPTSSDCSEDRSRVSEECHGCFQEATQRDEMPQQRLPTAGGVLDIYCPISAHSNCLEAGMCGKSTEAQGGYLWGASQACDDDAATLLGGLDWGRNPGGAEGGGEVPAALLCCHCQLPGLRGIDGGGRADRLVLLFWKLTSGLPLCRWGVVYTLYWGAGSACTAVVV